jgi:hypothetical protein
MRRRSRNERSPLFPESGESSRSEQAEFTVRAWQPADLSACLRVFDSNVPRFFVESEREDFSTFLSALPGPYFVIQRAPEAGRTRREPDIVGCGGWARSSGLSQQADLCWGMVDAAHHGRGLGALLLRVRLDDIRRSLGSPFRIQLNTSQHTFGFFAKVGFAVVRITPNGFAPGLDRYDMTLDATDARL